MKSWLNRVYISIDSPEEYKIFRAKKGKLNMVKRKVTP